MTNEDAIKWLENLKQDIGQLRHEDLWPYAQAIDEIIAMLEAQEPSVMTLEEVKRHNNQDGCVWFEQPTYNAVAAFARKDDEDYTEIISPYLLGDPINHCYMENRFYGNAWRCWTYRPTDEQRQEVKWNG